MLFSPFQLGLEFSAIFCWLGDTGHTYHLASMLNYSQSLSPRAKIVQYRWQKRWPRPFQHVVEIIKIHADNRLPSAPFDSETQRLHYMWCTNKLQLLLMIWHINFKHKTHFLPHNTTNEFFFVLKFWNNFIFNNLICWRML